MPILRPVRTLTLLLLLGVGNAHAGLMTLVPGTEGISFGAIPTAGGNQALPVLFGLPATGNGYGWYGAIVTGSPGAASYTYDVFGAEAGFRNRFSVDGNTVYTHGGGNNLSTVVKATYTGTTLDFSFLTNTTNSGSPPPTLITNDMGVTGNTNNTVSARPNFFASFDLLASTAGSNTQTGDVLWLFLDDSNQVDDNHDDLVVRITAAPVPLPPAATLFLAGLAAVGALRRRR